MAEKKIGAVVYRCDKVPADKSLRMMIRLTKVFGPAMSTLSGYLEADEGIRDRLAMEAIGALLSRLNEEDVFALVKDLVETCTIQGEGAVVFGAGAPDTLDETLQLAMWVLEVNYRDFFEGGLVKAAMAAARPAPASAAMN